MVLRPRGREPPHPAPTVTTIFASGTGRPHACPGERCKPQRPRKPHVGAKCWCDPPTLPQDTRGLWSLSANTVYALETRQKYRHLKTVQTRHVKYTPKDALIFEFIKCQSNSYYLKETADCLKKRTYCLFLGHFTFRCVKLCMIIT